MLKTNKEKLNEVIKAFYKLTGVKIAIYDTDYNEIFTYPEKNCDFCSLMWSSEKTKKCCSEATSKLLKESENSGGKTVMHSCHAGLTEVASAISDGDSLIGYVIFGQITNIEIKEDFLAEVIKKCEKYGIEKNVLEENINKIKYIDDEKLESMSLLLGMTVTYIITNRLAYTDAGSVGIEVRDYIRKNLSSDLNIDDICRYFFISRSILYKLTKPYMPDGVANFIKNERLKLAKKLLCETNKSAGEISVLCGYKDTNYFLRVFKNEFGISAGKYRKEN